MFIKRCGLLFILLFLPIMLLIDVLIGDQMTGVKTTIKQKFTEHKELYIELWSNK